MKTGLFFVGATFGLIAGALLVNNNFMARRFVRDTQDILSSKIREKANNFRFRTEAAEDMMPKCGCGGCWTESESETTEDLFIDDENLLDTEI
ncbi:MAG: hypothetical protein FWE22_06440 [Firmicutes bacterium]|nr:hypothetical protein [Bacillota bacterium]